MLGILLFWNDRTLAYVVLFKLVHAMHGFKNRTGPAGSTGLTVNRPLYRSGYVKNPEIQEKSRKTGNRRFNQHNRRPERSNRLWSRPEWKGKHHSGGTQLRISVHPNLAPLLADNSNLAPLLVDNPSLAPPPHLCQALDQIQPRTGSLPRITYDCYWIMIWLGWSVQ